MQLNAIKPGQILFHEVVTGHGENKRRARFVCRVVSVHKAEGYVLITGAHIPALEKRLKITKANQVNNLFKEKEDSPT